MESTNMATDTSQPQSSPLPQSQSLTSDLSSLQKFNDTTPAAADDADRQAREDDDLISRLLAGSGTNDDEMGKLNLEGPFTQEDKADDAIDFEDIDDDDLAEDEDELAASAPGLIKGHADGDDDVPDLNGDGQLDIDADLFGDEGGDGFDDLFGGGDDDLPMHDLPDVDSKPDINGEATQEAQVAPVGESFEDDDDLMGDGEADAKSEPAPVAPTLSQPDEDDLDPLAREQARLFRETRERQDRLRMGGIDADAFVPPPVAEDHQELLDEFFPEFDPGDKELPYYSDLFFRRRTNYITKAPPKAPTKVQPTRPTIEVEADQERAFKLSSAPKARKRTNEEADDAGLYFVQADDRAAQESDDNIELVSLHDEEVIGGVSVQDLRVLCEDWDSFSVKTPTSDDYMVTSSIAVADVNGFENSPPKRRKLSTEGFFESVTRDEYPLFDDPEALTAKLAKRIPLDMNDSRLLLDFTQATAREVSAQSSFGRRREVGGVSSAIHKKFNFSNDEEYERLVKENSIRGAVGNIPIEHSGPARRLQYPYYKTHLSHREQRNFHRPALHFAPNSRINIDRRLEHKKVKDMRKMTSQQAFAETKDLTLADNSSMLLLEYSEEMPLMMSNFGMNSRVINYYRRKDEHDKFRPKEDVGEPRVLQEKDQSPFLKFGFVDPGQTTPTIHNNLYRSPIFKHDPQQTDFLVIRRQTGVYGTNYHLRNIDNLHVVGQQLPFQEVPGTHGRKVTSTQKARMKMIAFRIYAKKLKTRGRHPYVPHNVITTHFPGSDVAQNRSKMRELMQYNKDHGSWEPKPGDEKFLDMEYLRNEIKPEDICLIDSMQVGNRQMLDAGYDAKQIDNDKDEAAENQSLDAQLVHWRATKNFLAACGDNAMIALHGEGDPTGRGEALNFVKISMKGGFQPLGASITDRIKGQQKVDQSGHKYNVRDQEEAYHVAIRHIWDAQKHSLSMAEAPDLDVEMDDNIDARIERNASLANSVRPTPRSEAPGTPGYFPRQSTILDDDGFSHISGSRISASDRAVGSGMKLKVTYRYRNEFGDMEESYDYVDDPVTARQYKKKHDAKIKARLDEQVRLGLANGTMTPIGGNSKLSEAERKATEDELARLQKNKDRRMIREAQKKIKANMKEGKAPEPGEDGKPIPGQTQRKCANCGMLGHIKTNKKLCPMLNGQWPNGVPPGENGPAPAVTPGGSEAPTPGGTQRLQLQGASASWTF